MIVAVLDTNTIVSGVISPTGAPAQILDAARSRQFTLATSPVIVGEVLTVMARARIRHKYHITADDIEGMRALLERETTWTIVRHEVHGVATHSEDDLILATALSAEADYLVTGDMALQSLGHYEGVSIVSPRVFLDILATQFPD